MSETFERMQRDFEIFVNAQAAEIEAVRAVLQCFLVAVLSNHPEGTALFSDLRTETLRRLALEKAHAGNDQDAARKAELVHTRAAQIFDEMAPVFDLRPSGAPEKAN
jgi:hypothetical protein